MHLHVSKEKVRTAAHKGHWLVHLGYLTAAAAEGHLVYSTMAALTGLFMIGCAVIGGGSD